MITSKKTASLMVLIVSVMVLFMVSAYAVQENNITAKEKNPTLNNTTGNDTNTAIVSTNLTGINYTNELKTAVSENVTNEIKASINSTALNANNATANENSTSNEQRNVSMKELGENQSNSYNISKYSTVKPLHKVSAGSNIKDPFDVGGNSESSTFSIGTTAKPGLDVSKNASLEHTFDLGLPSKHIVETSKFPFMCNIV